MSYDLYFWRQEVDFEEPPEEILNILSEDRPIEGIAAFPRERVRRILKETFPEIDDGDCELTWEGAGSYFQINFGHADERNVHLITATCGYQLLKSPEALNRLIDACAKLGCAVYDPQEGKRYKQPEPRNQL
jgi:hypothetical protein